MSRKFCMRDMWETKTFATKEEYKEYLIKRDKSMRWIVMVCIFVVAYVVFYRIFEKKM